MLEIKSDHNVTIRSDSNYFRKVDSEELSQQLLADELQIEELKDHIIHLKDFVPRKNFRRLEWLGLRTAAIKHELGVRSIMTANKMTAIEQAESIIAKFGRVGRRK